MGLTLYFPLLPVRVAAAVQATLIMVVQQRVLLVVRVEAVAHQAALIQRLQEVLGQPIKAIRVEEATHLRLTVEVEVEVQALEDRMPRRVKEEMVELV